MSSESLLQTIETLTDDVTQRDVMIKALPECVNDFATPCVINLLRMVVLFQSFSFAQVVG